MLVPVSWLEEYLGPVADLAVLIATLDDLGLVVDGVHKVGEGLDDVVVVRVESIDAIKGADRIRLATVTDGTQSIEVVCGAWNYEVGSLVPLAPVGAVLPGGFEIARRTMRGAVSNGMLCSGAELGLGDDSAGLLVLNDVDGAAPGRPILEVLGLTADTVLDITVEGNRPDAWCVEGIARDLAARSDRAFEPVEPAALPSGRTEGSERVTVQLNDPDLCGRFTATVLDEVTVAPSPRWLQRRLELAGMRPINNVVDASNYVMLELGQPTHPYDLDRVGGHGFVVRRARTGEVLELLDGTELELAVDSGAIGDTGEDLVICDATDAPIGLAGVMGGAATEIADTTTTVVLEAAWFDAMAVARSSKRHKVRTEASARFERGCDPWLADRAVARFVELLALSSPGLMVPAGMVDERGELPVPHELVVDTPSLAARLGVELSLDEVTRLLRAIDFTVVPDGDALRVTPPSGRPDIRPAPFGEADVAEEVARLHGYASLPARTPSWPAPGGLARIAAARRSVREAMVGLGGLEAWTATIVREADAALVADDSQRVRVTNPVAADEPVLRSSLLPGLLGALRYNLERRQGDVALFETGVVFTHPAHAPYARVEKGSGGELLKLPSEEERVGLLLGRPGDDAVAAVAAWRAIADALRLERVELSSRGDHELPLGFHATRAALLVDAATRTVLGAVGEVDPDVAQRAIPGLDASRRLGWLDLSLTALEDPELARRRSDVARLPSRFPSSDVDLALVVADAVDVATVKRTLCDAAGELCESIVCFDAYRGAGVPGGSRSLALRIRLCADDRTLSDAELAGTRAAMIDAATSTLRATLR